jgi:hypothetical protein
VRLFLHYQRLPSWMQRGLSLNWKCLPVEPIGEYTIDRKITCQSISFLRWRMNTSPWVSRSIHSICLHSPLRIKHCLKHHIYAIEINNMNVPVSRSRSQVDHNVYHTISNCVLEPVLRNATGYKEDEFWFFAQLPLLGIKSGGLDLNGNSTLEDTYSYCRV